MLRIISSSIRQFYILKSPQVDLSKECRKKERKEYSAVTTLYKQFAISFEFKKEDRLIQPVVLLYYLYMFLGEDLLILL